MKSKLSFYLICLLIGSTFFSSCKKEDIDETIVEEEEIVVDVIDCESLALAIVSNGGALGASASDGNEPYTYMWSTEETTAAITVEESGTYSVTVTDSEGCTATQSVEFDVEIPVDNCEGFAAETEYFGADGVVVASATGGTAPYTYTWSTEETTDFATIGESGTYTVTVTDANGCTLEQSVEVETEGTGGNDCSDFWTDFGGEGENVFQVYIGGGTEPYDILWSTGETTETITISADGTYSVVVTDAAGCTSSLEYDLIVETGGDCASLFGEIAYNSDALDGLWYLGAGGTPPYTYMWSTGETTTQISITPQSGVYSVMVIDANGCTFETSIDTGDGSDTGCPGFEVGIYEISEGILQAEIAGGTAPYNIFWSNEEMTETADFSDYGDGPHTVFVSDANGCVAEASIMIDSEVDPVDDCADFGAEIWSDTSTAGNDLMAQIVGGTAPYQVEWVNSFGITNSTVVTTSGAVSLILSSPDSGTYFVNVTDANGCAIWEYMVVVP